MYDINTSTLPPAADRSTHRQPPLQTVYFLEDLKGKVFWEAMDPHCCQFLHQVLERRKPEGIQMIFSEVKDQIPMLMFNQFGSSVIEKLYEVCDEEQMNELVLSVTAHVELLKVVCLNSRGSESMKKFLECLRTPEQISHMISIFQQLTVPLVKWQIGYRVIRHCFDIFPAKETEPILDVITDNILEIATNKSGSCFLVQFLISKVFRLESRPHILSEIVANVRSLSHDPFGFHVVQCVIGCRMQDVVREILVQLKGNFACRSMDRYATDVVLRLMEKDKEEYAPQIINEIIRSSDFSRVLQDPCGKYVLEYAQKCSTVPESVRKILNHQILLHSDHLHSHPNRKNVRPRWKI